MSVGGCWTGGRHSTPGSVEGSVCFYAHTCPTHTHTFERLKTINVEYATYTVTVLPLYVKGLENFISFEDRGTDTAARAKEERPHL